MAGSVTPPPAGPLVLVPCNTGTAALIDPGDGTRSLIPVEAWDNMGVPWVAGDTGLAAAPGVPGFLRLVSRARIIDPPQAPAAPPDRVHIVPCDRRKPEPVSGPVPVKIRVAR